MAITIELTPELQTELARQAAKHGVGISDYVAGLLEDAAHHRVASGEPRPRVPSREVVDAIERLKTFGKTYDLSPGGMTIRELRHEARP
jgi:hypothetical protein